MFSQFQRKWRHRLVDVYLAGTIFVSNAIGVLARVDGQTSTTFGVTRSTEIVRLTRTAYDNFALALYAGRTDRGFSMTWDAGQGVITVLGGTLTLGGGNANNINFASNYLVLGVPGTRIGPNTGASPGQMIIGGAVGSTAGEYATGSVELRGVSAGTNAATNISGGSVVIRSGDGASGSAGAANGGNVVIGAGAGFGTGARGVVKIGYDGTNICRVTVRNTILGLNGYTSSTADPTTTDLPVAGDYGVHKNTTSGTVYLAFNDAGTIKKVALE